MKNRETLIYIYKCFVNPERFTDVVEFLEEQISNSHNSMCVGEVDNFILENAEGIGNTDPAAASDGNAQMRLFFEFEWDNKQGLSQVVDEETLKRLLLWRDSDTMHSDKTGEIIKFFPKENAPPRLGIARKTANDRIGFFAHRFDDYGLLESAFRRHFAVTEGEFAVLVDLLEGSTPREIAKQSGKSVETVRNQVKSVAAKFGVSRTTDVVRHAAQSIQLVKEHQNGRGSHHSGNLLRVARDRDVEYEVDGPASGRPVVFFHCLTSGRHWPEAALKLAAEADLRLVRISRSGFSDSTPSKNLGLDLLNQHAEDCRRILLREGIKRCTVFAQGMGFPSAYRFASLHPGKVNGLVGLDVVPPILSASDARKLRGIFRSGAWMTMFTPNIARIVATLACRYASKFDGIDYSRPIGAPDIDVAANEDADDIDVLRKNDADCLKNGGVGYWQEATCAVVDWIDGKAGNKTAIRLIQTRNSPFVEPDSASTTASTIGASLRFIDSFQPILTGPMPTVLEEVGSLWQ